MPEWERHRVLIITHSPNRGYVTTTAFQNTCLYGSQRFAEAASDGGRLTCSGLRTRRSAASELERSFLAAISSVRTVFQDLPLFGWMSLVCHRCRGGRNSFDQHDSTGRWIGYIADLLWA
jgi:hypothetical protein